jgi:hypothetical protein
METMDKTMCVGMETKLAELLLDPAAASAKVKAHVDACEGCRAELDALRGTMTAMDAWTAPDPNPYFMTRFEARLREEKNAPPASWPSRILARLKASWLYGPRMQARPLAAMALTVCVLIGGGAYLNSYWDQPAAPVHPATDAAVVHDLQTLDNNAQLLDQLEAISSNDQPADSQTQE